METVVIADLSQAYVVVRMFLWFKKNFKPSLIFIFLDHYLRQREKIKLV